MQSISESRADRDAPAPHRVLIIGTGSIGRRHIANLRQLVPEACFAFLRADGREDSLSAELRAHVVRDIGSALEWKPTLAVVASPSDQHATVINPLLQAGVACYIEKPVVIRQEELVGLETRWAVVGPATQVGCVLRFLPSLRLLKSWLEQGRLGRIVRASFEVGQWLPDWRPTQDYRSSYSADRARGGGVIFDLVHELDLACWLFGDVELLAACGGHRSVLEIDSEDVAALLLRGGSGEVLTVQLDYVCREPVRRIHIVGDAASAVWDLPGRRLDLIGPQGTVESATDGFDTPAAYVEAMRDLLEAARTRRRSFLPLAEGLRATRLAILANSVIRRDPRS